MPSPAVDQQSQFMAEQGGSPFSDPRGFSSAPYYFQQNSPVSPANPHSNSYSMAVPQHLSNSFPGKPPQDNADADTAESIYANLDLLPTDKLEANVPGIKTMLEKINFTCALDWPLHALVTGEPSNRQEMEQLVQNTVKKIYKNFTNAVDNLWIFTLEIAGKGLTRPYLFSKLSVRTLPLKNPHKKTEVLCVTSRFSDKKILNILRGNNPSVPHEIAKWKKGFEREELLFFVIYEGHALLLVPLENTANDIPLVNTSHWRTSTSKKVGVAALALSTAAAGAFLAYTLAPPFIKFISGQVAPFFMKPEADASPPARTPSAKEQSGGGFLRFFKGSEASAPLPKPLPSRPAQKQSGWRPWQPTKKKNPSPGELASNFVNTAKNMAKKVWKKVSSGEAVALVAAAIPLIKMASTTIPEMANFLSSCPWLSFSPPNPQSSGDSPGQPTPKQRRVLKR
jgi:hypothetical protein